MSVQRPIRCVIMRGGTSKGIIFREQDLPKDPVKRDKLILRVFGAPDIREIDGLAGADTLTSKVVIIGKSTREGCDVDYTFGQVSFVDPFIDWVGNCGNLSSLVGPYAVNECLVKAEEPVTTVRINQTNTKKVLVAEVQVKGREAAVDGDYSIHGVPGTGAEVKMDFSDTAGAVSGKLLPTGKVMDELEVEGVGRIKASIVDAGNPVVFVDAKDFGCTGYESPSEIDANKSLLEKLEVARSVGAEKMGLTDSWKNARIQSPIMPMIVMCAPPGDYVAYGSEEIVRAEDMDIAARMIFVQYTHKTYAGTGTVCTGAAAMIPGTMVNLMARDGIKETGVLRIGHPQGVIRTESRVDQDGETFILRKATFSRTARLLMTGTAYVPEEFWKNNIE